MSNIQSLYFSSNSLPRNGYVRLSTVLEFFPVSKSTWWNGVKAGIYPQPYKLGERMTAWKAEDIWNLISEVENAQK